MVSEIPIDVVNGKHLSHDVVAPFDKFQMNRVLLCVVVAVLLVFEVDSENMC